MIQLSRTFRLVICITLVAAVTACSNSERSGAIAPGTMPLNPTYRVNNQPILGTYANRMSVDELADIRSTGMNLVIGHTRWLDTTTAEGAFCQDSGLAVLLHMAGPIYGQPHLATDINAVQTEIPLADVRDTTPASGIIQLDDEFIRYTGLNGKTLTGCERGYGGTTPAKHRAGMIVFRPDEARERIEQVKDSRNLWGYYVLDDSPGDALSALRALYAIIKEIDPERPVVAGYGGMGGMHNFAPDVCDLMFVYIYSVFSRYDRVKVSEATQWLLTVARERVPGIPFVGVYQGFWGAAGVRDVPLERRHIRDAMEDMVRNGAEGLVAYTARSRTRPSFSGWNFQDSLLTTISEAHDEILATGALGISPETPEMASTRIQPEGFWTHPVPMHGLPPAWHVVGPFDDIEREGLSATFSPDSVVDLMATYTGKDDRTIRWIVEPYSEVAGLGGVCNRTISTPQGRVAASVHSTAYLMCDITSTRKQEAVMRIGSDDEVLITFDGVEVWRHEGTRGLNRRSDSVRVTIPSGTTRVLAKVHNILGQWGFHLRFTDTEGHPLEGLSFSPAL
jgi:hypothetical protein